MMPNYLSTEYIQYNKAQEVPSCLKDEKHLHGPHIIAEQMSHQSLVFLSLLYQLELKDYRKILISLFYYQELKNNMNV